MLSARSNKAEFDGWLPIREKESDILPFDFLMNRTLIVPRLDKNVLNTEKFEMALQATIDTWVESAE
ncbi:MAG: hypothetical protein AAF810_18445 [Cyanobacteria bacterium P01_D01_bin.36]